MPRRTFLRGAGATLALPLLEAMVPASTVLAQTAARPKSRFVGIFFPHGMSPGHWEPATEGVLTGKLPYIMESLQNVKDQTVILSGLWSKSAEPPEGTTGSDHWVAAAFLTGIKPKKTAGSDATVGSPTIDQIIARAIGQDTLLPSLQLAVEDPNSSSSNCGEGYSCLHEFHFVGRITFDRSRRVGADEPASHGAQPAGRLRAPVRQRRHSGGAGRSNETESKHSRFASQ